MPDNHQPPAAAANTEEIPSDLLRKSARLPQPLSLPSGSKLVAETWKLFKKRWANYVLLSGLHKKARQFHMAQLESCLADNALQLLDGFEFEKPDDERTVDEILTAFDSFTMGKTNEMLERYIFWKEKSTGVRAIRKISVRSENPDEKLLLL